MDKTDSRKEKDSYKGSNLTCSKNKSDADWTRTWTEIWKEMEGQKTHGRTSEKRWFLFTFSVWDQDVEQMTKEARNKI